MAAHAAHRLDAGVIEPILHEAAAAAVAQIRRGKICVARFGGDQRAPDAQEIAGNGLCAPLCAGFVMGAEEYASRRCDWRAQSLFANFPQTTICFDGQIVLAGVNYHFNWGGAPIVTKY